MSQNNDKYAIHGSTLTGIADAIRSVNGSGEAYTPAEMQEAILKLSAVTDEDLEAIENSINERILRSGDRMEGDLTLAGDPTAALHAATKQYVDKAVENAGGGGGIAELPDNVTYFDDGGEDIKITDRTMVTIDKMSAEPMSGNPVLMAMMPVGYVFTWEPVEGNPTDLSTPEKVAAHYGFGTWEQLKDTFLLSAGDIYEIGSTGGEATHTLTIDEMPQHDHMGGRATGNIGYYDGTSDGIAAFTTSWQYTSTRTDLNLRVEPQGGDQPHNNMPPYRTVYTWTRVK